MLNFGVFLAYAVCIVFFEIVRRFYLSIHIIMASILLVLSILAFFFSPNFEINPFRWFGLSQYINLQYLDGYPIFPSIFFFGLGGIIGRTLYKKRKGYFNSLNKIMPLRPVNLVGRHSLWVYLGHVILFPIIFVIVAVSL
jgi:uncharacterized membrane protein